MDQPLSPQLDPEQFRRVWQRVMPNDRPDCPITLAPLPAPPIQSGPTGLGEDSAGDLALLGRLLCLTGESRAGYRSIAGGRRRMARLQAAKERQMGRLGAAYFLIAGERCDLPTPGIILREESFPLALRACYRRERRAAAQFLSAAERFRDPSLTGLCREIGQEDQAHAQQLREWLEQM